MASSGALGRALKDHSARQQLLRAETERLRKEANESVSNVTDLLVDVLNQRVMQVFTNQRELENEAKRLQALSSRYSKQTTQWLAMIDGFNTALKELGDVQSWARSIENDMRTIAQALEYVHQGAADFVHSGGALDDEAAA